jgi:hypothetical protein
MIQTMIQNPRDYVNPFSAKLVEQLKQAQREREQRAAIYRETKDVVERALKPDAATFAAAVVRAAAKARGTLVADTPRFSDDRAGRRAKEICNSARKARGLEPFE